MNIDLAKYSSELYNNVTVLDKAKLVLDKAEEVIVHMINMIYDLSLFTETADINLQKGKILTYMKETVMQNRTMFNTNWSWNIIPRSQISTSNNQCRFLWNYFITIVDNGDETYGSISYGNVKPLQNNVVENTNIANFLLDLNQENSRIQMLQRQLLYRRCSLLNILGVNNKFL